MGCVDSLSCTSHCSLIAKKKKEKKKTYSQRVKFVTCVCRKYSGSWFTSQENVPHLAEPEVFLPTMDNSMVDRIRETCMGKSPGTSFSDYWPFSHDTEMRTKLCRHIMGFQFNNSPKEASFTDHHWTHTWATKLHDPWGIKNWRVFFNIEELNPNKTSWYKSCVRLILEPETANPCYIAIVASNGDNRNCMALRNVTTQWSFGRYLSGMIARYSCSDLGPSISMYTCSRDGREAVVPVLSYMGALRSGSGFLWAGLS